MTERLTEKFNGKYILRKGVNSLKNMQNEIEYLDGEAIDKLAEYETAEEEGRLVVLPCAVGTCVYEIYCMLSFGKIGDKPDKTYEVREVPFGLGMLDELGTTVFLTKEEAEKALKETKKECEQNERD